MRARKTAISNWEKKLDDLTPHVQLMFNCDVFSRAIAYNMTLKVQKLCAPSDADVPLALSEAILTLTFSLQPYEGIFELSESFGKDQNDFKQQVVSSVI